MTDELHLQPRSECPVCDADHGTITLRDVPHLCASCRAEWEDGQADNWYEMVRERDLEEQP